MADGGDKHQPGEPGAAPGPVGGPGRAPGAGAGRAAARSPVKGYPESVVRLIDEFARLPGIGRRSAERLAFHVLKTPTQEALGLARAVQDVKERVRHCRVCYNLADAPEIGLSGAPGGAAPGGGGVVCAICAGASADPRTGERTRDASIVMVVEQPKDLIALEQTGMFQGVYHVLMGRIAPLEGVGAGDLTISALLERLDSPSLNAGGGDVAVREVVLALNPTLEGDGTALYLGEQIAKRPAVKLTRLARGLPTGSQLEYANKAVLADAIQGRRGV